MAARSPVRNRVRASLFGVTLGLSAYLLFLVQPLVGRLVLPLLGGAAAVWTTCLLFFQAALLAAYAWAHVQSRLPARLQAAAHVLVLVAAAVTLPLALRPGWQPPSDAMPAPWLVGLLAVSCGAPVFALASNAPTLQRWYALAGGRDPYVLYAVSNAGSLLGLLSYPLLWEPALTLTRQRWLWSAGYLVLAALVAACAAVSRASVSAASLAAPRTPSPSRGQVARWVVLAAVPASLTAGVTAHITTDLAPVPLLWVVPLSLYLLTFVTSFGGRPLTPASALARLYPVLAVPLVAWDISHGAPSWALLVLHLASFTLLAALCHGRLSAERPAPDRLTAFYLWMAAGGVTGGLLNAVVAPLLFSGPIEYPLMLVAAAALVPLSRSGAGLETGRAAGLQSCAAPSPLDRWAAWLPVVAGAAWAALARIPNPTVALAIPALRIAQPSLRRPMIRLAASVVVVALIGRVAIAERRQVSHQARSFFASLRVVENFRPGVRALVHGVTLHGLQATDPALRRTALTYYAREGPIGQVIDALGPGLDGAHVGLVGLGVGELAVYARPGQQWTFFEIDPVVVRIARDPRWFTYLADAAAPVSVVLGDGRLSLDRSTDRFGLLVIDAFNSDAVPTHLLTREALAVYLRRLDTSGMLAFHVSNRFADLEPVVGTLARDAGLDALARFDAGVTPGASAPGRSPSRWIVLGRPGALPPALRGMEGWKAADTLPGEVPWSDERSDVLRLLLPWRRASALR